MGVLTSMTSTIKIEGGKKLKAFLELCKAQRARVDVGFFPESTYGDGTKVAQVAVDNEYGHVTHDFRIVPARPFLHPAYEENKSKWMKVLQQAIIKQGDKIDAAKALKAVGVVAQNDVRQKINWWAKQGIPRNAEYTVEKKGFNSPLIETGQMKDAVNFKVISK